ncbi:nuclease-related domain-containing protein [Thiohalomonas denitrificans]|uniref:Nuclease-related domain-containing protein n=1 Tax=Thiohalomonas denitrificans TaxID=415747 RepID=A0A1G5QTR8_9GAMM|nr:nuclease-related domain-containing protein [Thiohalomonas denitrificans]SCZ65284.1 Nuclease-related domain-containing protein [Thiohalomonas denitrificans]
MNTQILLLAIGPASLLLALAIWLLRPALCRRSHEKTILRTLRNLGPEIRRDIVLEDGIEGLTFIDYAVMTPDGVMAVEVLPHKGAIFGAEHADQWSQVIGRKTTRFPNPLARTREQVTALRLTAKELKPRGLALFGPDCTFPKGKPPGVAVPDDLKTDNRPTAVPATLYRAWQDFIQLAEQKAATYQAERALMREKHGWGRSFLGVLFTIAAAAWAVFISWEAIISLV